MLLEVYYENYKNCKGAYWEEEKILPYAVREPDFYKREKFYRFLKHCGFRCVTWNYDYPVVLVNMRLRRFGLVYRACMHASLDDCKLYSLEEFLIKFNKYSEFLSFENNF